MDNNYPILEFDPSPNAILEPRKVPLTGPCPEKAVLCFFQEIIHELADSGQIHQIGSAGSEIGPNPLYELVWEEQRYLVLHPGVGAPLAAGFLEEVISLGVTKAIACGGCGVLNREIAAGHPVVLTSAVRDEGTSYHYLPPAREVSASPAAITALESVLQRRAIDYRLGKSWTTDGFYRETVQRRARRMAEGCEVVEMEASAFFAVAQFRGMEFGQVVYGGDLVHPEGWDLRGWHKREDDRHLMFWLAVEACSLL
jgi:purine-nucleoside phosphorylase